MKQRILKSWLLFSALYSIVSTIFIFLFRKWFNFDHLEEISFQETLGTITLFLLILLFFLNSAVCASALSSLDKFDKNFDSAANKEKIAMHQELRTLYVKSIMENNVNLRVQSLTRLIKSSKALGLDTKPYEKELASIPQSAKPSEEKPKQEIKQVKKEQQKQEPKQKEVKLSQLSSAPLAAQNAKTVKNQTLQLLEALDNDGNFELKFSRQLNGNDIKKTDLNQKGSYKTIYEFKGIWSGGKLQRFKNYLVDEIRISQFDEKTVRVVFVSQFEPNLKLRVDNQSLIFSKAKPTQSQNLTKQVKILQDFLCKLVRLPSCHSFLRH